MTADQWWIMGALCAVMAILWVRDIFSDAPLEAFDTDLSRKEQEAEALGVVDSMKGELDYMRKDGLL